MKDSKKWCHESRSRCQTVTQDEERPSSLRFGHWFSIRRAFSSKDMVQVQPSERLASWTELDDYIVTCEYMSGTINAREVREDISQDQTGTPPATKEVLEDWP
ncbi:hypothetical protein WG66_005881 [Moniliophthora roreri]|nr:hypothetical protein WG66_005881 [Moniliophthora roreri]